MIETIRLIHNKEGDIESGSSDSLFETIHKVG